MNNLSEKTLRRRAAKVGCQIKKGFKHYHNGAIYIGSGGEREVGYLVIDEYGNCVWGSFDQWIDHTWQLEEVEEFLKGVYKSNGLKW